MPQQKSSKGKAYNCVTGMLQDYAPEYFNLITSQCMQKWFTTQKGDTISILIPKDPKRIAAMEEITRSSNPEKIFNIINSLIIIGKKTTLDEFGEGFQVKNGDMIEVSKIDKSAVHLKNGCKIEPIDDLKYIRGDDSYFNAFWITGTELLTGDVKGGSLTLLTIGKKDYRFLVRRKIEHIYKQPIVMVNNQSIYFAAVYLLLSVMEANCPEKFLNGEVAKFLGNDEITDFYLLSLIAPSHCFGELWELLGKEGPVPAKVFTVDFKKYAQKRNEIVSKLKDPWGEAEVTIDYQKEILKKISHVHVAREIILKDYGGNLERLGRDLFLCYANTAKIVWLADRKDAMDFGSKDFSEIDSAAYNAFLRGTNYLYLTDKDSLEVITYGKADVRQDMRIYFTLVNSDNYKHSHRSFDSPARSGFPVVDSAPEINKKEMFSMCALMVKLSSTGAIYLGGFEDKYY